MSLATPTVDRPEPRTARLPRTVIVAAWTVPLLVVVQFAMLAVVPVVLVLIGTVRVRLCHGWAAALAVTFAVPLVLRAIGPDPGLSLSRSMGPVLTAVVVAVSTVVALGLSVHGRRHRASA